MQLPSDPHPFLARAAIGRFRTAYFERVRRHQHRRDRTESLGRIGCAERAWLYFTLLTIESAMALASRVQTATMPVEEISPSPPRQVRLPTMSQRWDDAVFLHWETDPSAALRWLPPGVRVDMLDGRTYVGLVCLSIEVSLAGLVPLPYLGQFPEVNVRLYSVDRAGRRGIVFCSLDAARLAPTLAGRAGYGLPYIWSHVLHSRDGDVTRYAVDRRWPGPRPASMQLAVRTGEQIAEPSQVEHFMTARWTLHWQRAGISLWAPAAHEPWPLHQAELLSIDDGLVESAGLPPRTDGPISVLWSPGVRAFIGPPRPIRAG
jgi:uncharacterized protein